MTYQEIIEKIDYILDNEVETYDELINLKSKIEADMEDDEAEKQGDNERQE